MRIVNIDDISRKASIDVKEVIDRAERYYIEELENVADNISRLNIKIVLISGPSSAGKTTTSFKLQDELKKRNILSHVLNMDDFFIDMSKLPLREDGKPDIENICALDVKTIRKCLGEIIEKNETKTPQFDFVTHTRLSTWVECKLTGNEIIIMEGIHAHNPSIVEGLDKKRIYKIYLDCETKFCFNNEDLGSRKEESFSIESLSQKEDTFDSEGISESTNTFDVEGIKNKNAGKFDNEGTFGSESKNKSAFDLEDKKKIDSDIVNTKNLGESIESLSIESLREDKTSFSIESLRESANSFNIDSLRSKNELDKIKIQDLDVKNMGGEVYNLEDKSIYDLLGKKIDDKGEKCGLLSSREIRLLRRMIRDERDRDVPYLESIEMWKEVCRGENRNILPYKSSADFVIDTVHDYELLVFSFVVEEKFKKFSQNETIAKYLSIFKRCAKINEDLVPMDSLLREFIGPNNVDDRKN